MNRVPDGFELADEPQPWVLRNAGAVVAISGVLFSGGMFMLGKWLEDQQRPHLEEIRKLMSEQSKEAREARVKQSRKTEQLATFNLERYRYSTTVWSLIAESANVKLPPRPKELDRAEDRVRDIQEGAN